MKTLLRLTACSCLLLIAASGKAQVTKLSNNTNLQYAITLNNKAVILDNNDSVWVTDATAAGTFKLRNDVSSTGEAVVYKNKIYAGGINAAKGAELWISDCTPNGTKIFKDINTGAHSSYPTNFFVFNNILFFFAYTDASGYELWKSDGTAAGTTMVKDIWKGKGSSYDSASTTFFYPANGLLFFQANDSTHGKELWKTDGTTGGTALVKDLNTGIPDLDITTYSSLNNKFIFSGKDASPTGIKVWSTDGTSGGTTVLKTLLPTDQNSVLNPLSMSRFKSQLIFSITGYIFNFPQFTLVNQLYTTDGTSNGTKLLKDLGDSTLGFSFGTLTPTIKTKFYFTSYSNQGSLLWESDGTTGGTKVTKVISTSFNQNTGHIPIIFTDLFLSNPDSISTKTFKGKFFMAADDGVHGYEPWITNGTAKATKLVKDINKNAPSSLSLDSLTFVYTKQALYFSANDGSTGVELWMSDGTGAGTTQVANINPGKKSSGPLFSGYVNGHLLFAADDGDNAAGNRDLYAVTATVDTLRHAGSEDAAKVSIAPDGSVFSIYPNPAKDKLNISFDKNLNSQHVSLIITNQKGEQLYYKEISAMQVSGSYSVDISRFATGTYYLEVRTDKGVTSSKFIKAN